jgi:hypothetical protein
MVAEDPFAVAALRAGSIEAREPLGRTTTDDPWSLGELARVIAGQNLRPDDWMEALDLLNGAGPLTGAHQGLRAQLTFALGDRQRTAELLRRYPEIDEPVRTALRLDLANPYAGGTGDWDFAQLLPGPAVRVADGLDVPFDRLTTAPAQRVGHPARITTIVTAYQPGPGLITAVRSLVAQTWTNHEILVVDDDSPHGHDQVLDRVAALDPRVRVIRLAVNGGTYVARNTGLDAATGEFVTFQDSDDWSHPLRLERQVAPLLAGPEVFSTTSVGLRVTPDLLISRPGVGQIRSYNLSSLMVRRAVALDRLGHFDPVRTGADAEYVERARAVLGRPATQHLTGQPLALIRLSAGSLSGADYRPGWMHPARRSYLSAFQAWHRHVAAGDADPAEVRKFAAPWRVLGRTGRRVYDVVLAADWTVPDGGLGRLRALRARGMRIALLHLDDLTNLRTALANLDPEIQDAINSGELDQVELSDDVRARLVVVRSPALLRYPPAGPSGMRADKVVIEAGVVTAPRQCAAASGRLFGVDPVWAPPGPDGRTALAAAPDELTLTELDLPGSVDVDWWRLDRRGPRAARPVVGRHCVGDRVEWQRLRDELPEHARIDVRLLDDTGSAEQVFGRSGLPGGWLVYAGADLSLRNFLYQVDFYLHLPSEAAPADAEPPVLTAMAAGCVVVLPPRYAGTFGDAAVYCTPDALSDTVRTWHGRTAALRQQSDRGREFVRQRHSHDRYADQVVALTC